MAPPISDTELAQLAAMRRMALGAAHALNNAFTAVIGEAGFLREDRKDDPRVVEGCDALLEAMDRCARITKALLVRREPNQAGSDTELVRTLRELGALLGETLGSRNQLSLSLPDDIVPVRGSAAEIELVLVAFLHYAADAPDPRPGRTITLSLEPVAAAARIQLDVRVDGLTDEVVAAATDAARAADGLTAASLGAAIATTRALGGDVQAARTAPDAWRLGITLPLASDG